jgi:hypothetical protein
MANRYRSGIGFCLGTKVRDCPEEFGGVVIVDEIDYKARVHWDAAEGTRVSPEPDNRHKVHTSADGCDGRPLP